MSTIYILWLRQIKRYTRSRARMIGSLGQPLFMLLGLGYGFGHVYEQAGGGNYIQFLAPGIIAMAVLFTGLFSGIEIIWDRKFGFLKETLVAPVSRISIMAGRTLGGASIAVLQGLIVFGISFLVGFRPAAWSLLPLALLFMFLLAILFTAIGTAIASMLEDMQGFQLIMNFLVMPLFFFSGAIYPLDNLPKVLSFVTKINPLSYGVDGMRGAFAGISHFGFQIDLMVLVAVGGVVLVIGSYLFSKIEI